MKENFYVYILASARNGTLYIGITSDLIKRVYEHKNGITGGFTKKYSVKMLVYYEVYDDFENAVAREKAMKAWKRNWKLELIEKNNQDWADLYESLL
jgi:putative endonuclease